MKQIFSMLGASVLLMLLGLGQAQEPPRVVVVSELPQATNQIREPVAPRPTFGREIGPVTAPLNVTSQTVETTEITEGSQRRGKLLLSFDGGFGGLAPADINGAVGPDNVVSFLNGLDYIYTKSGTLVASFTGQSFWCSESPALPKCPNTDVDPRLVYDFGSERWVTSALAGDGSPAASVTWLAVSQTSDPTAGWYLYAIPSCGAAYSTDLGDQPTLGINGQWIVVKDRSCAGINNNELTLHVFDKASLYSGAALKVGTNQFDLTDAYDLDQPVLTYAGSTIDNREYLAASNVLSTGKVQVVYSYLQGSVDAPVLTQPAETVTLSVRGNGFVPLGYQLGCTSPCIGSEDDARINSASLSDGANGDGYVVVTFAVGKPVSSPTTSAVILVALDTSTGLAVSHVITIASPKVIGYPSIALEEGANLAEVGYALFTQTNYPAAHINEWDIGANTVYAGKKIAQSTVQYTYTQRWGDFSSTVLDPANASVVWTAQDYDFINYYTQNAWWQEVQF